MSASTRQFGHKARSVPAIPEIVAHRGYSYAAPENTLAAINLGWMVAADGVEIDIHLTADNHIVVQHDPSTARTCGVDMKIAESTLDELRALNAGSLWGCRYEGEKLPTFEEALATIPEGKRMLVEIKCHAEIVPEFLRVLDASRRQDYQVAVISFYDDVIAAIKKARPSLQAYWLCSPHNRTIDEILSIAQASNADGLDAMAHDTFDEEFVRRVREAGLALHTWTVDADDTAGRMAALGVDGITTNRPAEIRAVLEGRR